MDDINLGCCDALVTAGSTEDDSMPSPITASAPTDLAEIEALLDRLISREACVLSYDHSLLDQLPDVLVELHGIRTADDAPRSSDLLRLVSLLKVQHGWRLDDLPGAVRAAGIDETRFRPRQPLERLQAQATQFEHWNESQASQNLDSVLQLQKDLGMGRHGDAKQRYPAEWQERQIPLRSYLRGVTTAPAGLGERLLRRSFWELRIRLWQLMGRLSPALPSLSVGPRWVTEIRFFREVLGLRGHIGLDLFSDDPELVTAGDMHAMPFPDNHFQLVFLKNVVDKSYDVRTLVTEVIRVLRPGGIVIVDQICGYGACSPLTRTDIQRANNLLRLFAARCVVKTLVCNDIDVSNLGDSAGTGQKRYNARLAVRIPIEASSGT